MFEFTCTANPSSFTPRYNHDLDGLLASLDQPRYDLTTYQSPPINFQYNPRRSQSFGRPEPLVYHVPEDMPVDMILRQLGVDSYNIHPSTPMINYSQPTFTPIIQRLPPSVPGRRYLVCREVTEMDGDDYYRPPPNYDYGMHRNPFPDPMAQSPSNIHNLLNRVWNQASAAGVDRPGSPNFNPSWQGGGGMSPHPRDAVDHVWQRARSASDRPMDYPSPGFNRMGSPPNNYPPLLPPSSPANMQDPSFGRMPPPMNNNNNNNWNRPGSGQLSPPPTLGNLLSQAYRSRIPPSRLPNTLS